MSEMEIPKQTKKMLLFVSPANEFWPRVLKKRAPSQNEIATYMGASHATIPGWKSGGGISQIAASNVFDIIELKIRGQQISGQRNLRMLSQKNVNVPELSEEDREWAIKTLNSFRKNFYDERISMYMTAENLGMSVQECQKIMDEVIYKRGPIFPRMYFESKSNAISVFSSYRGVYLLWVRRSVKSLKSNYIWIQAPLRVRYVIQIGGGHVIRCKMNAPIIEPELNKTYWEYDGFLVKRPNKIYWMFEKRERDRNDYFYFITSIGRPFRDIFENSESKIRTLSGIYLTTGQDEMQTEISDKVFIQRVAQYDENDRGEDSDKNRKNIEETMQKIMHSQFKVVSEEFGAILDTSLEEFEQQRI